MSTGSRPPARPPEWLVLIENLVNQTIDEAGFLRLEEILRRDAKVRAFYRRYMNVHAAMVRISATSRAVTLRRELRDLLLKESRPEESAEDPFAAFDDNSEAAGGSFSGDSLNDAMILPALHDDEPEPDRAIVLPPSVAPRAERKSSLLRRRPVAWAAAASVLLVAGLLALVWRYAGQTPSATIVAAVDARWQYPGVSPQTNAAVPHGQLTLVSGLVELAFRQGATSIIEGPATFEVESGGGLKFSAGQMTAHVPASAVGFTVRTPHATVTDLGTEFGVAVDPGKQTHVEVFVGKVMAAAGNQPDARNGRTLSASEAIEVSADGSGVHPAVPRPLTFVRAEQVASLQSAPGGNDAAYARWLAFSQQMRRDPNLAAYYPFDNQDEAHDRLLNRAEITAGSCDGQVQNATWARGRFPGKAALSFNGNDSAVKVNIPNRLQRATIGVWFQPRRFSRRYTALLMSEGFGRPFKIHCQIQQLPDGVHFNLGLRNQGPDENADWEQFLSGSSRLDPASVQWHFVAFVYDQPGGIVRWFVDGKQSGTAPVRSPIPLEIGPALIGNFLPEPGIIEPQRGLQGGVDELMVFGRALAEQEIGAIYRAGVDE